MKIFKAIFGRIWAVWLAIAWIGTMLLYLIPFTIFIYFRKDPKKTHMFNYWSRYWINTFLFLVASPLKIKGRENFVPGEVYIVLVNHNTFMDVPITTPAIPGGNKTIAKVELSRIPLFGMLYKTGSILVDRKSDASRKESFGKMKNVLSMGLHMCIYPEGTRNKTKQPLKSFHNGAFKLAIDTGKSIVPSLILNSGKMLREKAFYAMPQPVEIHFLKPVAIVDGETVEQLRDRVHKIMSEYYSQYA